MKHEDFNNYQPVTFLEVAGSGLKKLELIHYPALQVLDCPDNEISVLNTRFTPRLLSI